MNPQEVIAHTLWGEARGEPIEGIQAVTSVIYNRTRHYLASHQSELPEDAMQAVCLSPHQFSCWSDGAFIQELPHICNKWSDCIFITSSLISGQFQPIIDATSYHADSCKPYWTDSMTFICQIGKHLFYK